MLRPCRRKFWNCVSYAPSVYNLIAVEVFNIMQLFSSLLLITAGIASTVILNTGLLRFNTIIKDIAR